MKKLSFLLAVTMFFDVESSFDVKNRSEVAAQLEYVGQKTDLYIEKNLWQPIFSKTLEELGRAFDELIFAGVSEAYGSVFDPGKIKVLISDMATTSYGYIKKTSKDEAIHLNARYLGSDLLKETLAHEFQHLITLHDKEEAKGLKEEIWLLEALAEYAPISIGYNEIAKKRANDFLRDPSNSLTDWSSSLYDYAPVNLFMNYVVEQKGEDYLKEIIKSDEIGAKALSDFTELYKNWTVANFINDCEVQRIYCYQNKNLSFKVPATAIYNLFPVESISVGGFTEAFSPHWYKVSGLTDEDKILRIRITGNVREKGTEFYFPYVVVDKNNNKMISELNDEIYLKGFGKEINSVTIIPSSNKKSDFSFSAAIVKEIPPKKDEEKLRQELLARLNDLQIIALNLQKKILEIQVENLRKQIATLLFKK